MEKTEESYAGTKNLPKVFIVISSHNGGKFLPKMLLEIFRSNYSNCEVVLVDNNSTDGSIEEIRGSFSKVTLIRNSENIGISAGMNVGIRYALERGAKYILILRQNTGNLTGILPVLVAEMEQDNSLGLSSPVISEEDGQIAFAGGHVDWFGAKLIATREGRQENYLRSDYLRGAAILVRAEVFRRTGLLNEKLFMYFGEEELSFKAKAAGYKLLISSQARVISLADESLDANKKEYWLNLATLLFFKKNTPAHFLPWIIGFFSSLYFKNWLREKYFKKKDAKTILWKRVFRDFYNNEGFF